MGKIKSALEIAMEKTENIAIDENKIRENQENDRIRRIAGEYLSKDQRDDNLLKGLEDYDEKTVKRALKGLLLSSLALPTYEVVDDRYERLLELMRRVLKGNDNAIALYQKLIDFVKQYPLHRKQLIEALQKQMEPMLEQKSEAMSQKLGRPIKLTIEDDKETLEILEQNLEHLEKQYNDSLANAKKSLEEAF